MQFKKYLYSAILAAGTLVLSYMNCAPAYKVQSKGLSDVQLGSIEKPIGSLAASEFVFFVNKHSGSSSGLMVNLSNGQIEKFNEGVDRYDGPNLNEHGQVIGNLPNEDLTALIGIVTQAVMCQKVLTDKSAVCSMALVEPHTIFFNKMDRIYLGRASNGCRNDAIEVCDEHRRTQLADIRKRSLCAAQINCTD